MQLGDLLTIKTTGELVYVLSETDRKTFKVRRPVMSRDGITHFTDEFFADELETIEEHLRRELADMKLKARLQKELLQEEPEDAAPRTPISIVN
jgi:hypothetical protein